MKINWNEVSKLRNQGLSWHSIGKTIGVGPNSLRNKAADKGFNTNILGKAGNANKRMCLTCRKYFYKKYLIKNSVGLFCSDCYKKRFGGESRYVKNQLGIQYD